MVKGAFILENKRTSAISWVSSLKPSNLPVATKIANQVICLPIYPNLETLNIKRTINNKEIDL